MISDEFSIPKGGYARIYKHEVKIFDHKNKEAGSVPMNIAD